MKLSNFDMLRVWAAVTGLLLAIGYFATLYFGIRVSHVVLQLAVVIGGFELALFGQDLLIRRRGTLG